MRRHLSSGRRVFSSSASPIAHRKSPIPVKRTPILVLLLMAGCRDPVFSDMTDSTYVRTMVALRKLPVGQPDTTLRVQQRDSILKAFGVTVAQIESTTVRLALDPVRALAIWRAIENPRPPVTPP